MKKTLALCLAVLCGLVMVGCSGDGQSAAYKQDTQKMVEKATQMRTYFTKAQGDYSRLSDDDKAAFVKLAGDEAKADQAWNLMKNGPNRPSAGSQAQ